MVDTKIAHAKAQSDIFGKSIQRLNDGVDSPEVVVLARRLLLEYHRLQKALARDER